jgi:hypothetical protein
MKKFFIALSVLAALSLTVVPSQALVGMPDRVPANELISIFVVAMDQTLDTLIIVQEIGVRGQTSTTNYNLHWKMWDANSAHKADRSIPYTRNDVVAISCRDIIFNTLTVNERTSLEADLDTDGVNESYIGYITWNDELAGVEVNDSNHFVGKMYIVNLEGGIGSGVTIAGREALVDTTYEALQMEVTSIVGAGAAAAAVTTKNMEAFSPIAYAVSQLRERSNAATGAAFADVENFRLLPRWYLYTSAGENNIFIWKSFNTVAAGAALPASWSFSMMVYDNEEHPTSKQIHLPQELNFIDVREVVPPDWIPASGTMAGWFDIRFPSNSGSAGAPYYWQLMDFLAYSWQRSANASSSLNWSVLFEVNRQVDTLTLTP